MRGFLVGTLFLVVVYTVVQPNAAKAAAAGSNVITEGIRRALSPTVAGIPARKTSSSTTKPSSTSTGSTTINV